MSYPYLQTYNMTSYDTLQGNYSGVLRPILITSWSDIERIIRIIQNNQNNICKNNVATWSCKYSVII